MPNSTPGVNPGHAKPTSGFAPRRTEVIARETILGLFLQVLDLTQSQDPRAWELAGQKLDEAADVARVAERELLRRQAITDSIQFRFAHLPAVEGSPSFGTQLLQAIIRGGQAR